MITQELIEQLRETRKELIDRISVMSISEFRVRRVRRELNTNPGSKSTLGNGWDRDDSARESIIDKSMLVQQRSLDNGPTK